MAEKLFCVHEFVGGVHGSTYMHGDAEPDTGLRACAVVNQRRYQGLEEAEEDFGSDGCLYVHRDTCMIVSRAWAVVHQRLDARVWRRKRRTVGRMAVCMCIEICV